MFECHLLSTWTTSAVTASGGGTYRSMHAHAERRRAIQRHPPVVLRPTDRRPTWRLDCPSSSVLSQSSRSFVRVWVGARGRICFCFQLTQNHRWVVFVCETASDLRSAPPGEDRYSPFATCCEFVLFLFFLVPANFAVRYSNCVSRFILADNLLIMGISILAGATHWNAASW